jgi:hypothetical protein
MLSLYLAASPPADLAARAGELMVAAEAACGQPMAEQDRTGVLCGELGRTASTYVELRA